MKVKVTENYIKNAKKAVISGCPLSLAMTKGLNTPCLVDYDIINFENKDYRTPTSIRLWLQRYDFGDKVEPFTLDTDELIPSNISILDAVGIRGRLAKEKTITRVLMVTFGVVLLSIIIFLMRIT